MAGNTIYYNEIISKYNDIRMYGLNADVVGQTLVIFILFIIFSRIKLFSEGRSNNALRSFCQRLAAFYSRNRRLFSVMYVFAGIINLLGSYASFRYGHTAISDKGSCLLLLISLQIMISFDAFYFIFVRPLKYVDIKLKSRFEDYLVVVALLLFINGIVTCLLALFSFLSLLWGDRFGGIVYTSNSDNNRFLLFTRNSTKYLVLFAVFLVLFFSAYFYGTVIKRSSSGLGLAHSWGSVEMSGLFTKEYLNNFLVYVIHRISIYYYSYLYVTNESVANIHNLFIPISTFFDRINILFGGKASSEWVKTIMRLNYLSLYTGNLTSRSGASPGILASFGYIFAFPFNMVFSALYLSIIEKVLAVLLNSRTKAITIFGCCVALLFLQFSMQSPIDALLILDGNFISFILLFLIYMNENRQSLPIVNQNTIYNSNVEPSL
ncbi:MAG: hypothetical protein P1U34_02425 [Coxiellaceae bacterium]|nr:hypothetical protein [Coxiellaceae bacterium]